MFKTKKIGTGITYKRPPITIQEQLTAEDIEDKLQGYELVTDVKNVALNTHVRYFSTAKDGSQIFRMGGFLRNKENADTYIILGNDSVTWPVQMATSVLYRKLSHKEEIEAIHKHYKNKLKEKDSIIKKLSKALKQQSN